jgi:hypothetical protein
VGCWFVDVGVEMKGIEMFWKEDAIREGYLIEGRRLGIWRLEKREIKRRAIL